MKAILKMLFLLFATVMCLTSDTATSSVPQASHTRILSVYSYSHVNNGPMPRFWESPSWDLKLETSKSYLTDDFVPVIQ